MKKNKILVAISLSILSLNLIACNTDLSGIMNQVKLEDKSKKVRNQPLIINMPSVNYNLRPENTKIDTIIIHHTAPFASLTRVGYFFQDINSRVSAHYTVGKEGLIIQSVDEKNRAWHAGPSGWLGKTNVNDFSIGIEILNDGDGKDPFTPLQYNALVNLVSYLMKKHNVPLERVVGHRDIGYPLGRKVDPADNFDWKMFKTRLRGELGIPKSFWGGTDNPQENNARLSDIISNLRKDDINIRTNAVDTLLTVDYKDKTQEIDSLFKDEKSPIVKTKYLRLFEVYDNKKHIDYAYSVLNDYKNNTLILLNQVVSYLYFADKDNAYTKFWELYNTTEISKELKISLIKVLTNYKKPEIRDLFLNQIKSDIDDDIKKNIAEGLSKQEDKTLNKDLIQIFDTSSNQVKIALADTLRITFDTDIENKLITVLNQTLTRDVIESIVYTLTRKDSIKGIEALIKDDVYNRFNEKMKVALFNAIGKTKNKNYEDFLLSKLPLESDVDVKSSIILSLGRIAGDKSFDTLSKVLVKIKF
ncbi:MAG: N-acetylmuramoyl-L-alanine amidase [Candidatus Sericytochromatia bacterium]